MNMSLDSPQRGFAVTTKLWFGITPIIFSFFLLSNIRAAQNFDVALAFISIYVVSILVLSYYSKGENKHYLQQLDAFWLSDITKGKFIWFLIAVGGIFGVWFLSILIDSSFIGILLSGAVLMLSFLKTNAILVPIFAHGVWNSFVVAAKQGLLNPLWDALGLDITQQTTALAAIPITVPEIGIGLPGAATFFTEMIWQFVLVSTAEETMKIAIMVFVIFALRKGFRNFIDSNAQLFFGAIAAIAIWGTMHTINTIAFPINLFIMQYGVAGIPLVIMKVFTG